MVTWDDVRIAARSRAGRARRALRRRAAPVVSAWASRRYVYDADRYRGTFLARAVPGDDAPPAPTGPLPRRILCFWTGDNPLTPARASSLDALRRMNPDLEVALVTPGALEEILVPGHPLHPAYEHLSLVHRADYLRAYAMHHHGGGYTDIKAPLAPWAPAFDLLDAHPEAWVLGYPEIGPEGVPSLPGALGRDLHRCYRLLVGQCAFIMRPHTPFTTAWMGELHARLDASLDELRRHPGGVLGDEPGYPLAWAGILAEITHPLMLRHHDRVLQDWRLLPGLRDYR